jgi:hypothetical protein
MHGFFPNLPFRIIFLLTSTGQTGKPISIIESSNDAFTPKKVLFGISLKRFELMGSVTPKNRQKVGVVYAFPAKLGESIKTHISVSTIDIDRKFEL